MGFTDLIEIWAFLVVSGAAGGLWLVPAVSIVPSIAAPPGSSEHQHQHTFISMAKQTSSPSAPGLLSPLGDERKGGDAKYYRKRLRGRREQQAEDLGPDLSPSSDSTQPLIRFA